MRLQPRWRRGKEDQQRKEQEYSKNTAIVDSCSRASANPAPIGPQDRTTAEALDHRVTQTSDNEIDR